MQTNKNFLKKICYGILFIIGIIVYYFLNKNFNTEIPCIIHKITNLYCPGCGITRMFFSLLNLNFYQAFRYNPLIFILLCGYVLLKLSEIIIRKKIKISSKVIIAILIIVITFGILRNIPYFSYLLPTTVK